jgi:hypothetical protein
MPTASESSVAGALEAQSKTLETQSKLLQQISERLDAQDRHWATLGKTVTSNVEAIRAMSTVQEDLAKMLVSRIQTEVSELQSSTGERVDALDRMLTTRVSALESATASFERWRPSVEHSVGVVQAAVDLLRADVNRLPRHQDQQQWPPEFQPGILGPYGSMRARPVASASNIDGPRGHCDTFYHREEGPGGAYAQSSLPNNGMRTAPPVFHDYIGPMPHDNFGDGHQGWQSARSLGQLPKVQFPGFDGDNPKLWQKRCEDYFHMYSVDPSVWIRVSTMHFTGPAARWLQSVEYQLSHVSWTDFGTMIRERFGKDQHAILIRQLFHIRQGSTVTDYVERFSQLVDQLKAYHSISDPLYYTMRFIDGLRDDVKSVVMVQRPKDLDTAFVLAQLQEEVADKRRDYRRFDVPASKNMAKSPLPLPPPPSVTASKLMDKTTGGTTTTTIEDKLTSLYAYRRVRGLCYKCGLQYSRGHRCADSVQLHVMEELWQLLPVLDQDESANSDDSVELNNIVLSQAAVTGNTAPKTIQMVGHIQGLELLVLIDSGSSHSFVSSQVAVNLQGLSPVASQLSVQIADGA